MRQEFLQVETLAEACNQALWAAVIIEVDGGYLAFESVNDYITWSNQD